MTDVPAPRARSRPAVVAAPAPRSRIRPATPGPYEPNIPTPAPRVRQRIVIPNALELPVLMRAHNRIDVKAGEEPDIRFAPMIIVPKAEYLRAIHPVTKMRADEALRYDKMTDFSPDNFHAIVNNYITEIGLRRYCGKQMIPTDVLCRIEEFIVENRDLMNGCQKSIISIDWDADDLFAGMDADLTKASGPYYCDGIISLDIHYAQHLKPYTKPGAK